MISDAHSHHVHAPLLTTDHATAARPEKKGKKTARQHSIREAKIGWCIRSEARKGEKIGRDLRDVKGRSHTLAKVAVGVVFAVFESVDLGFGFVGDVHS
jgi:hypothetical protein